MRKRFILQAWSYVLQAQRNIGTGNRKHRLFPQTMAAEKTRDKLGPPRKKRTEA